MEFKFDSVLEGKFITLKKVVVADAHDIYKWRTSKSGQFLKHPDNYDLNSQIEWIKNRKDSEANYIIYQKDSNIKVGMIGIYDVNINDKVTDVGRLLLAEEYLTKSNPYGLEALLLTYNYVFEQMGFKKITGVILGLNLDMFKMQKFLGMQQEGFLKQHVVIHNNREDLFIMSLFAEDFSGYKNKINLLLRSFK